PSISWQTWMNHWSKTLSDDISRPMYNDTKKQDRIQRQVLSVHRIASLAPNLVPTVLVSYPSLTNATGRTLPILPKLISTGEVMPTLAQHLAVMLVLTSVTF